MIVERIKMLHLVINNTDKLYTNNISRGLFRTMSNRIRPSVDVISLSSWRSDRPTRYLRAVGEDKKIFRALHARACIEILLVPLVSSTRWVLEYPLGRGYEYAEISYAILTRAPRFSMFSSRSTMKLYVAGVLFEKREGEERGEAP